MCSYKLFIVYSILKSEGHGGPDPPPRCRREGNDRFPGQAWICPDLSRLKNERRDRAKRASWICPDRAKRASWSDTPTRFLSTNGANDFPQIFSDFSQIDTNGSLFKYCIQMFESSNLQIFKSDYQIIRSSDNQIIR